MTEAVLVMCFLVGGVLLCWLMERHMTHVDRVEGEALRRIDEEVRSAAIIDRWRADSEATAPEPRLEAEEGKS